MFNFHPFLTAHSVPVNVPSRLSGHHTEYHDSDSGIYKLRLFFC